MAGIGEASAIIGTVQIGFSLARTLNTYIGDYKDSRDSIISLAAELEATIIQVKELRSLVENSRSSNVLGEGSIKLAEKCTKDSDRLIKRLVELLTKARLPEDPAAIVNIKPEDIFVGRLTRAYWPLVKPQVDVVRSELHLMKTDILLARSCIQSQTGSTPADRAAGDESIVAHAKSLKLARQLLRKAKDEEQRSTMSNKNPDPAYEVPGRHVRIRDEPPGISDDHPAGGSRVHPLRRSTGMSARGEYGGAIADRLALEIRADIARDLERKQKEQKDREAADEAARKAAVELYQETLKEQFARLQTRSDVTSRQMKEIFGSSLDEKQLQKFLEEQQLQHMQDDFGEALLKLGLGPSVFANNVPKDAAPNSEGKSFRTNKKRWFSRRPSSRTSVYSNFRHSSGVTEHRRTSPSKRDLQHEYIEGVVTFSPIDHYVWEWTTIHGGTLQHEPCGKVCDLQEAIGIYQTIPLSVRSGVLRLIGRNRDVRLGRDERDEWHLHAAMKVQKDPRRSQKILRRALLGSAPPRDATDTLLVYCRPRPRHELGLINSRPNSASASLSPALAPRVEISQTDLEQLRAWLNSIGLSTARVDELEAWLVKQRDISAYPDQPTVTVPNNEFGDEKPKTERKTDRVDESDNLAHNDVTIRFRRGGDSGAVDDTVGPRNAEHRTVPDPVENRSRRRGGPPPETERNAAPDLDRLRYRPDPHGQLGTYNGYPAASANPYSTLNVGPPDQQWDNSYGYNNVYPSQPRGRSIRLEDDEIDIRPARPAARLDQGAERTVGRDLGAESRREVALVNRRLRSELDDEIEKIRQERARDRRLLEGFADELAEMRLERPAERRVRPRSRRGSDVSSASSSGRDRFRQDRRYDERRNRVEVDEKEARVREVVVEERMMEAARRALDPEEREVESRRIAEKYESDRKQREAERRLEQMARELRQQQHEDASKDYQVVVRDPYDFRYPNPGHDIRADDSGDRIIIEHDRYHMRGFSPPPVTIPNPFSPVSTNDSPDWYNPVRERERPYQQHENCYGLSPVRERPPIAPEERERKRELVALRVNDWDHYPKRRRDYDDYITRDKGAMAPWPLPTGPNAKEERDEASDAEDAYLDDEQLKNKMLVKYTSGGLNSAAPQPFEIQQHPEQADQEATQADKTGKVVSETSPVPGIRRNYTATVEEIEEEDELSNASAGPPEYRAPRRRASSSSRSTRSTGISRSRSRIVEIRKRASNETVRTIDDEEDPVEPVLLETRGHDIPPAKRWW